jgi:excisionase family DNA binding protein
MSLEDSIREIVRQEIRSALADAAKAAGVAPSVLTSEEAAKLLRMPIDVLRKRVRKGEIPAIKIGSLLRFRVVDLDAWLESLKKAS